MAASSVQILGASASPFSIRVKTALNLKSIHHEFIEESLHTNSKSKRLLKANPVHKKVPVLVHDQRPICESLIILQYIDEAWADKGPSLLPSDAYERATARFWAAYIDDKWFPTFKELENEGQDEARSAIIGRIYEGIAFLEEAFDKCSKGKGYFGGDNLGYIDVVLGSYLVWIQLTESAIGLRFFDQRRTPGLAGWCERFASLDAAKHVLPDVHKLKEFYMMFKATKG